MQDEDVKDRRSRLSDVQRALLEKRLRGEHVALPESEQIRHLPRRESAPLSFAQQRLWFIDQLEPGNPAYTFPLMVRLSGRLDRAALRQALDEIVRRHEVLRTTFPWVDGRPVQAVSPPSPLGLPLIDLSELPEAAREEEARRLANEDRRRPFDLARGPVFRVSLVRLGPEEHALFFTLHHIVSDIWSVGVLAREVGALYVAFTGGRPSPLPELPVQYADFAVWQREWLSGRVLETQLDYWKRQLADAPSLLELPTDHPRPSVQTLRGATQRLEMPAAIAEGLKRLGREEGATLFMTLLAAFQVLLHRYTGQTDLLVGTATAGRDRAEVENLIGFFVNTLVLRADLSGDPGFREFLRRVRGVTLGAYAHQDVPFEKLVEELNPERSLSYAPLFQVAFGFEPLQDEERLAMMPGLTMTAFRNDNETAKFDLVLYISETAGGLSAALHYSSDLFEEATVKRLLGHFRTLLEGILRQPEQALSELPLLEEAEQHEMLYGWNATAVEYPRDRCIHELFEERAAQTPDSTAVVSEGRELTYGELNARANQLAHHLRGLGVGAEVPVGLCCDRSPEMLVGLLGILKAGGAYVPLDPAYPLERLSFIIDDAAMPVLLVQEHLLENLPAHWGQVVCLDADWETIAAESEQRPAPVASPDNLAYVIYTSGSTGRPKGVEIAHRGMLNMAQAQVRAFSLRPENRVIQFASLSFDASVFEIVMGLTNGAELHLARREELLPGTPLLDLLRERRVTNATLPPSALGLLPQAELPDLHTIIVAGEACGAELVKRWTRDGRRFFNAYGPSEATVWSSVAECRDATRKPDIGRPIDNVQLYVLDGHLRPVPVGVAGELHIGGAGLARGYLRRPALTARQFVPNPFSAEPGARLYKTGDRARFLPGGRIDFLGRADDQVKVRGFRIELGEIEAALLEHAAVREALVVAREDEPGDRRLVAYLTSAGESAAAPVDELRAFLRGKLPDYMLPAAFVFLDALPVSPNGKVDRRALPAPGHERPAFETDYVAPRDAVEEMLAGMWRETLGVERIGVRDDFFSLGGDSIKGAVFINGLQSRLDDIVHVVTIFNAPTVEQLADYLRGQHAEALTRVGLASPAHGAGHGNGHGAPAPARRVTAEQLAVMRRLIRPLPARARDGRGESPAAESRRNPPAVFVLSPPRSGSTLFRVILAGHPELFSPPELELLSFNTLAERRTAFSGADSFWLEGALRALMEVRRCDAAEAREIMRAYEDAGLTTKEFYRLMQEWLGSRRLVDKTPSYALHPSILRRAEEDFEGARYVHLVRHPLGMIRSFEEAKIDQLFFRYEHPFTRRELAELTWLVCHQNILEFLRDVPAARRHRVVFEELVREPKRVVEEVCRFLGLEPHPDMLQPYARQERRMTDGIHAESRMLGDVKFHSYRGIEASVGERWKETLREDSLGDVTRELAEALGYGSTAGASGGPAAPAAAARMELGPAPARRVAGQSRWPLSYAQQRLWFIEQLQPGGFAYNVTIALRMEGRLDVDALGATLNEIVRRHEVLRTTFAEEGGQPVQVVRSARPVKLEQVDLSAEPEEERETQARALVSQEAARPFDLARGPLLRVSLLKLAEEDHIATLTMHHIVGDGWSLGVLVREVAALYEAFVADQPSPLPEPPIQYADFAVWQRERLSGEVLEQELDYWRRQLAGAPATLRLPTDRPRPSVQTHRGASHSFTLPAHLSQALRELSRRQGATLFMTLLAGWQALLSRYSGQDDVVVGTPIAGRNRAETESLVGFFVNTLALRADLSGSPTFGELLGRVREACLGAYAHQDLPFERLVEELAPERSLSHAPIFQVMFALQNAPLTGLELPGLKLSPVPGESTTTKFDMTLTMFDSGERIGGSLDYDVELFDASTAERFITHFETLLASAAADPNCVVGRLSLLGEDERRRVLVEWNRTERPYPRGRCVHELFEERTAQSPEAVALMADTGEVIYAELNARANRLARRLRGLGVGPEVVVGVMVERSAEMVVALLAVLKAGGAYLPLDPEYPLERLAFMIEDAQVPVLLTQQRLLDNLPAHWGYVLCLDDEAELIAGEGAENLGRSAAPDNLAYVMYTSGSTGRPKGVCVTHRAISRLVVNTDYVSLSEAETLLQLAPVSFDASTFEIWGALLNGARLAVFPAERPSLEQLADVLRRRQVTTLWLTAGLFHQMVEQQLEGLCGVRQLLAGGDVLAPGAVQRVLREVAGCRVINGYGPTEATTFTTCYPMRDADGVGANVPIGRPIANTHVYILDEWMSPVGVGMAGELYVGGDGLARGYLRRAGQTAERFVPDPFGADGGGRLYRTGDTARYLEDGRVEFLGRADGQVKVRGYRIETGEIEAALGEHRAVREAVVVARAEPAGGDKRLVAYVVAADSETVDPAELRRHLRGRLPDYMLPAAFVTLDELPLSPNGKVDRRALPEPGHDRPQSAPAFVAPSTGMEELLGALFGEVLGLERVGADDNFFESGGHSLLATQLVSRLRQALGVEVPLRELFERPTVRGLAQSVERLLRAGEWASGPGPARVAREGDAPPLSFAQQRLWFIDQLEPGNSLYNMPTALRLSGRLDVPALSQTLTEVCRRHEVLRTTFGSLEGQPVQIIHAPEPLPLPVLDLSALPAGERERRVRAFVEQEYVEPFDLAEGPLLRAKLLKIGEEEHVALFTMHHIVSDGWSGGVLVGEVATLYEAFVEGRPSPLPELEIQYADFAVWQRELLRGESLEHLLRYWREQLAGAPPVLELPTDRPRPSVQTHRGASHTFTLPADLTASLRGLSRREGATLFMTLLAGWQLLLSRYSGQEDVVVGTPIANRNRSETEPLIGFFVNTLALRTRLTPGMSFRELLAQVREACLGAYAHQDLPFEKLVEELAPERSLSHAPVFQVMFALQNAPGGELRLPGLTLSRVSGHESRAISFELNMILSETEEGLNGLLIYHSDLYDEATVARMVGHYVRLLEEAASGGDVEVMRMPLLSEAEREELRRWNETGREWARAPHAHEMFEEQARLSPSRAALKSGGEELSFAELNARANRLARHLRAAGAGPEVRVGLCAGRGVEMVVGLLAIFKSGGVYVPLDPRHPADRLAFVLEDADVSLVVTRDSEAGRLPHSGARLISLEQEREQIEAQNAEDLAANVAAEQLAYLIYTSGSTGRPKGVMVEHRQLTNTLLAAQEVYRFTPGDVVPCLAPFTFDISLFELLSVLAAGGKCLLLDAREVLDAPAARKVLEEVTFLHAATGLMRQFTNAAREQAQPDGYAHVRQVCTGGDKVSPELLREMQEVFPSAQVNVGYGPTEAAIMCANYPVAPDRAVEHAMVGAPMSNTVLHLFDRYGNLVPVGVPGEIYIGGAGLARGYLKRDELTREKFVRIDGERFYRSGDVGRRLPDGNITFLGRTDQQVKVRGYRVEAGEVEAALCAHEFVREAVVTARADRSGEKRLVAYVVCGEGAAPGAGELRAHLSERLPDYMVPAAFVFLDEIPLTAESKVDRHALPEPEDTGSAGNEYVAPRTPVEELLAAAFAEVLGLERVGAHDDFFARGGHSLLATQLISRVRRTFGAEVPLLELFEQPTVAGFAARVEAAALGAGEAPPPLARRSHEQSPPLSFAQQRLWFIAQLEPDSPLYNNSHALRLSGELNVPALERTLTEIVRRHEVIRTSYAAVEGSPVQVIHPAGPLTLPLIDLTAPAEAERQALITELIFDEWQRPFDLARGPILRVKLLRLGDTEHVVLFVMHHIASDGWSVGVLIREVAALYEAFAAGRPSPLPELPIQYADFAAWQREWLSGDVLEAQLAYWRRSLSGASAVLELPLDRPRPSVQTHDAAYQSLALTEELVGALKELSRKNGVTLFMTLLAAFKVLLSRYSGQEDVVVGTPIANRTHSELEPLIGFFVNMLALRTDLSGDPTFQELLARVREVCLGAYAHQDLPFEKLVEELAPVRSLSHSPLFQVAFSLENVPLTALRLPSLEVSRFGDLQESAKFDVSVTINEVGEQVSGFITYNTALFEAETIERMAGHFRTLLSAIVSDPSLRLSRLPVLADAERRLLSDWGGDGRQYRPEVCAHQLFEEQAARTPHRTALSCRGRHLSYSELDERAERLARRLRRRGVGPEATVGVLLDRTPELVVALFAVWKAGGAYLPLDPSHPRHRLSFILSNAEPRLVITQGQLAELLPEEPPPLLVLDAEGGAETGDGSAAEEGAGDDSPAEVGAEHLAYVIYTSGSTGEPKGVMVEHRQLVSTLCAASEHFGFAADDVVVCSAPAAFDIFLFELLSPLLCGGRVLLADSRELLEEAAMEEVLRESTFFHSTPGLMWQAVGFAGRQEAGRYEQVRALLVGGDAVPPELLRQMRVAFPSAEVHIGYGPTEATMISAAWRVPEGAEVEQQLMGRALGNVRLRLCDRHGRLVPVGVVGEVYIGGAGVARGYLKREELTRERFVEVDGERYYRSGDLARYLADGVLAFAGRADTQVKVRGYRIELGEVEAALARHPGVSQCAVVAREGGGGEKKLVAYVVGGEGAAPAAAELRAYLAGQVPQYMVPSQFVGLDALPLNANGKVEKRALPEPPAQAGDEREYVAPRSPAEELAAALWAEVLGVTRVGVHDDFFALGGHSILAARVVNRMKECFGVEVPLRDLFERPTVAEIVERVEGYLKAGYGVESPPLLPAPRDRPLPLSFAQQRLWFMHQLEPDSPFYNSPFTLLLEGALDVRALEATLNEIVRRHEILRTQYEVFDEEPVQVITPARPLRIPLVDLAALPEGARREEALRLAASEAQRPFDLRRAPMLRVRLLRLSETEHMLLFAMHHIVTDVGSMNVLIGEVAALYPAYLEGGPSPLPEFTIQYADYAYWQRLWLRGEVMEKYLAYWRRQLGGTLPVLSLPTDKPRPAVQTFNGRQLSHALTPGLGAALASLSLQEGCTLFMTLLAAFTVLLSRRAGQEDVLVGAANANRPHAELERLMGFFVNMLVVRADLSGNPTFRKLLARVKEATLGAYAHQEMPFERLVEEFVVKRSAGHPPLVQVAFGVRHPRQQGLQLPGLELKPVAAGSDTGRFDLTLWVVVSGDDLRADWIYNVDLFEAETITRLSRQFDTLLQSILAQPDALVSQLRITTAEEGYEHEARMRGRQEANAKRLKSVRRERVSLSPAAPPGGD